MDKAKPRNQVHASLVVVASIATIMLMMMIMPYFGASTEGISAYGQITPPSQLKQQQGGQGIIINGAGATFPFPLIDTWRVESQKVNPSISINYQSIGSGGGVRQFTERTVDFGASDA